MSKFEDAFGGAKISNIEDVFARAKTVSESINKNRHHRAYNVIGT